VAWVVVVIVVAVAGFFVWRAGSPSTATGGKPNDRDRELLQKMGEARERSNAGRGLPQGQSPTPASAGVPR
jgi:hypothetical protein